MADGSTARSLSAPITPPLKWAGGKRWLVDRVLRRLELPFARLIEPFAGSAAAFFSLRPRAGLLADNNRDLITTYKCIRWDSDRVLKSLSNHADNHCNDYYYSIRAERPNDPFEIAARLIYLNRTCWNALYRVNRRGEFNVPIGTKTRVLLPTDNFKLVAEALSTAKIRCADFSIALKEAGPGDLIFADPPYFCQSTTGTFVKYTNPAFSWKDQGRLAEAIRLAAARGAHFILTNANTQALRDLYEGTGHLTEIQRHSVISGQAKGRGLTAELLWTSFHLHL